MKRVFALIICLCLALALVPMQVSADSGYINVYNWGQYIADGTDGSIDVNKAFEEATGIKVNYMTFDSNETMYTKLKSGGSPYDVIFPSDYMVARLISEGLLTELDFDNIPNYQYIDESQKNMDFDPENTYSVPYTWGTVGIVYNKKYVDEEDLGSWDLLWNEKYSGKILMFDNPRDAFAIALLRLGYSINTTNEDELRAASYMLLEQKPLVQTYVMDQIYDKMIRTEAWIAPYYAGDYLMMADENEDLGFYLPNEGFNQFIDAVCIPTCCQNKEAAEAYINFLCSPEICGANLDYLGYSSPMTAAKEYMDPEMSENEIAYPSEETLAGGQAFMFLDNETTQLLDSLWLEVKTQGGDYGYYVYAMITVIVLAVALLTIRNVRTKLRKSRRCRKWKTAA